MAPRRAPIDFFERFFNLDRSFSTTGNMDFLRSDGSGVNREVRAPFCEGLRGKLPWSTHPEIGRLSSVDYLNLGFKHCSALTRPKLLDFKLRHGLVKIVEVAELMGILLIMCRSFGKRFVLYSEML